MARNGSGVYSLPEAAYVNGTTIEAAAMNSNLSDLGAALTASIAKDGQTTPTAALPMGGFRHTGTGAATARTDYARADQVIASVLDYAADTGSATAYAIAPSPGIAAYVVGQRFAFRATNANSGTTPTLAVNGLAAGTITYPDGTALAANDITAAAQIVVQVATTTPTFHLQTPGAGFAKTGGTQTITGAKTFSATLTMSGAAINEAVRVDVASATTTDIGAAASNYVRITGTTTITGLGTVASGTRRHVLFAGILTFTHNATSLILPTGANITTAAGDTALMISEGSGNWRCQHYTRASGVPLATGTTTITNILGADVAMNNTGLYFDGPSCAQGTTGTWFASGTVTITDTAGAAKHAVKLWDGTSTAATSGGTWTEPSHSTSVTLCGVFVNPVGNIRISVNDETSTSGVILFNDSGESKDSNLTVIRLA